ncbi:unnamed protein product [Effrenium voratum]|uniref:Uncharacterized protein n=1 Tax=Effrenium voratum TaxID=2562239 RepID=A0AA36J8J8_9DINO|nr:unnamed protein product [Effrenium voratum]CAJ1458162.1 unnamed protein product [Effrenium voratum]
MGDELRNAQDHELQAEMELRSQLEQAADAAAQPLSPMSPKTATVVLSPDALSPDASPGAFLAPGRSHEQSSSRVKTTAGLTPRPRPQEAIEREEELIETHSRAAERSSWNPEWETTGESWNARHHLAYCNDEMSQNTRCYFDRWLDHRELLPEDDLQVQKPTWRLEPEALSNEERQAERYAGTVYSPTGPGLRSSGSLPCLRTEDLAKESITRRRATRVSRDKPWVTRPTRFWELLKQEPCEEEKSKNTISTQTNFPKHEVSNKEKERQWDGHHHAVWSNFQNLQGTILNPAPVRSYFDRPREPDIGSRSAEKKSGNAKEGVTRILPLWRLEPLPDTSVVDLPEGNLWPSEPPLASRTGFPVLPRDEVLGPRHEAAPEFNHKSTWSCPSLLTTFLDEDLEKRKESWNGRHQLTFQNEEVSRLDRSYFDRFREHDLLRKKGSPKHEPCSVWSLGKDTSTQDSVQTMLSSSNRRFGNDGRWMHRHQLIFDNASGRLPVQRNLRAYFDRNRDFPSEASSFLEEVQDEDAAFKLLTSSALRKRRRKLQDSDKLKVDVWSLSEPQKKAHSIEDTFRSCDGDSLMGKTEKEKRRSKWMSSHHVVF